MNSDNTIILITFCIYLLLMFIIGLIAWHHTKSDADYFLGGRKLGQWTTALSAGASDMSGWLLLGLPGFAYAAGFQAIWIATGLFIGTYLNWRFVAPRLRDQSESLSNALTLPEYFEYRFNDQTHLLRVSTAFFILLFFIFYTSSGLVAGGKLFESVFNLPYTWAIITGTVAILLYTTLGGFLAVSWTDLIQGLLMVFALVIVGLIAMQSMGGWSITLATMQIVDPTLTNIFQKTETETLSAIAILSLLGWGLGYFGQPHILVRFMAIKSTQIMPTARRIAITWTGISLVAALLVGFTGIGLLDSQLTGSNTEMVFIEMVTYLFHPIPAGICLAAILAAIMSTADSQLLVASSAFTEDFYKALFKKQASQGELVFIGRLAVIVIAIIASVLALQHEQKILDLVAYAWAGFGAAFGPVLILSLYWKGMSFSGALAGVITGGLTVIIWHQLTGGIFELYELVPGFIFALVTSLSVSILSNKS